MQSRSPSLTAPSRSPARAWAAMSSGNRPQGQAPTQLAQRMQGMGSRAWTSAAVRASTPLLPLTIGTRVLGRGWPIMGPPLTSRAGSWLKPPQWSMRAATGVPRGTRRFFGLAMAPPVTVTIRETRGRPRRRASWTAKAVAGLCTTTPMSAVRPRAGVSRPVTAWTRCFSEPMG